MSMKLRILLALLVILADVYSVRKIRKGKMSLNLSLLWLGVSLVLVVIAIFPEIAFRLAGLAGIETPVNMVFLFFSFFSIAFFIYLTNVISKEDRINRRLSQRVALLEKRILELEEQAGETGKEPSSK